MRRHSRWIVTNPDMLHRGILPAHQKWSSTLRRVAYVVIDECHAYRGVFGSHVGHVLRRLRRICRRYGAEPVFVLASATVADPAAAATRLVGRAGRGGHRRRLAPARRHLRAVGAAADRADRRARGAAAPVGRRRTPRRCSPTSWSAAPARWRSSGRGGARSRWPTRPAACCTTAAATTWCAGSTPTAAATCPRSGGSWSGPCRRATCWAWPPPTRWSSASTSPGSTPSCSPATRARWRRCGSRPAGPGGRRRSRWSSSWPATTRWTTTWPTIRGRCSAGRSRRPSPTRPTRTSSARSCAAPRPSCRSARRTSRRSAARWRRRSSRNSSPPASCAAVRPGWYWAGRGRPDVDIRGSGGEPVSIIEAGTGRLLGTVDGGAAHSTVHDGALYVHRGDTFVVDEFDVDDACAVVHADSPEWTTVARDVTDLGIVSTDRTRRLGTVTAHTGVVDVTNQVVAYQRRRLGTGRGAGRVPAGPAGPAAAHARRLADPRRPGDRARRGRRGRAARGAARRRARGDRHPAAAGHLRPVGPRRPVHRPAPGHRDGDDLRLRRAPGRGRLQRARVRGAPALAAGDAGDGRQLRVRERLPLLRPVAQVRQRQRPARQGRRGAGARRGARRARRRRGPPRGRGTRREHRRDIAHEMAATESGGRRGRERPTCGTPARPGTARAAAEPSTGAGPARARASPSAAQRAQLQRHADRHVGDGARPDLARGQRRPRWRPATARGRGAGGRLPDHGPRRPRPGRRGPQPPSPGAGRPRRRRRAPPRRPPRPAPRRAPAPRRSPTPARPGRPLIRHRPLPPGLEQGHRLGGHRDAQRHRPERLPPRRATVDPHLARRSASR